MKTEPAMDPKYTSYAPDGTGRDGYIIQGNGGLCMAPISKHQSSTLMQNQFKFNYGPSPK